MQNTKKADLSISNYLLKIKSLVDQLFVVGCHFSVKDHIEAIFEGLPPNYDPFIVSVNSRSDPYTVAEIESLLLAQESCLERHLKDLDSSLIFANVAQHQRYGNP